jgi:uncharacterized protein (TIGR00369 family)
LTSEHAAEAAGQAAIEAVRARPTGIRVGGRRFELAPHHCFACGELNEHGLHLRLHGDDNGCWTELTLEPRFEGWDGIAHGGIIATLLDEVQAWAVIARGGWGVTARMSIEFRRPVPVGTPIRAEGRVTGSRRRIYETAGQVVDTESGEVLANAQSTFVAASDARRLELAERYGVTLSDRGPEISAMDTPGQVER